MPGLAGTPRPRQLPSSSRPAPRSGPARGAAPPPAYSVSVSRHESACWMAHTRNSYECGRRLTARFGVWGPGSAPAVPRPRGSSGSCRPRPGAGRRGGGAPPRRGQPAAPGCPTSSSCCTPRSRVARAALPSRLAPRGLYQSIPPGGSRWQLRMTALRSSAAAGHARRRRCGRRRRPGVRGRVARPLRLAGCTPPPPRAGAAPAAAAGASMPPPLGLPGHQNRSWSARAPWPRRRAGELGALAVLRGLGADLARPDAAGRSPLWLAAAHPSPGSNHGTFSTTMQSPCSLLTVSSSPQTRPPPPRAC
jgi:hypothetical protein